MKRSFHLIPLAALCLSLLAAACTSQHGQSADSQDDAANGAADSLRLDSAIYVESDSLLTDISLHIEYLTGSSPLAVGVRRYVAKELEGLWSTFSWMGESTASSDKQAKRLWKGDADDMDGMAKAYGAALGKQFRHDAQELNANVGEEYTMRLALDDELRLFCDADSFVTFEHTTYSYTGGAHGSTSLEATTFVRRTGQRLTEVVDTLQADALQPLLVQGICHYLNSWNEGEGYGENDTISPATLSSYLFSETMPDGRIPLPASTPALTAQGVLFIYGQYEIAPYAAGIITFTVPYSKIKPMLTPSVQNLLP